MGLYGVERVLLVVFVAFFVRIEYVSVYVVNCTYMCQDSERQWKTRPVIYVPKNDAIYIARTHVCYVLDNRQDMAVQCSEHQPKVMSRKQHKSEMRAFISVDSHICECASAFVLIGASIISFTYINDPLVHFHRMSFRLWPDLILHNSNTKHNNWESTRTHLDSICVVIKGTHSITDREHHHNVPYITASMANKNLECSQNEENIWWCWL